MESFNSWIHLRFISA